jgi:hypothetical protein
MHRLSLVQALSLWSDLDDAYYGKACFGSDVAEIYVHRLMPNSPLGDEFIANGPRTKGGIVEQEGMRVLREASDTFRNLLAHFAEERDAIVEIEDRVNDAWEFVDASAYFKSCTETDRHQDHRYHVRVQPRSTAVQGSEGPVPRERAVGRTKRKEATT